MADEKPPSQAAETLLLSSFPAPNSTKARASTGANDGTLILPSGGVPSVSASSVSESLSSYNENRSAQVLGQLTDQPVIPVDFRIGSVRFVRRLGAGNMGIVFLGHHDGLDRPVVVKTLNRRVELGADGEAALLRFREEARAVAQLSHQNIAQIFDVGSIDGIHYLVMEYIDGGSLKEHWEKRQPELPELVRILREIAAGLDAAHRRGIIHRDIKPDNIMLSSEGAVKIVDFGLAKRRGSAGLTSDSTVLGTPYYMAPEQCDGRAVDGRVDLYALGVTAFEALTGKYPFEGQHAVEVLMKKMQADPPALASLRPDAPPRLAALVDQLLSRDPAQRVANARDLLKVLDDPELLGAKRPPLETRPKPSSSSANPSQSPEAGSTSNSHKKAIWLLGAALLFLIVARVSAVGSRNALQRSEKEALRANIEKARRKLDDLNSNWPRLAPDFNKAYSEIGRILDAARESILPRWDRTNKGPPRKPDLGNRKLERDGRARTFAELQALHQRLANLAIEAGGFSKELWLRDDSQLADLEPFSTKEQLAALLGEHSIARALSFDELGLVNPAAFPVEQNLTLLTAQPRTSGPRDGESNASANGGAKAQDRRRLLFTFPDRPAAPHQNYFRMEVGFWKLTVSPYGFGTLMNSADSGSEAASSDASRLKGLDLSPVVLKSAGLWYEADVGPRPELVFINSSAGLECYLFGRAVQLRIAIPQPAGSPSQLALGPGLRIVSLGIGRKESHVSHERRSK